MRDHTDTDPGKAPAGAPSWRDVLPVHPAADLLPRMAEQHLRKMGDNIRERGLVSPIAIFREVGTDGVVRYSLLDGISRLDAMELVGIKLEFQLSKNGDWIIKSSELSNIDEDVVRCRYVCDDPYEYVLSANIHRRHLTTQQRLELLDKVTQANPNISSRRVAKLAGVSPTTAAKSRRKLEATGDVSTVDTSTDTKGRKQPTHKPPPKPTMPNDDIGPDSTGEVDRLRARVEQLQNQLADRDRLIKRLQAEIDGKDRRLRELSAQIARLDRTLAFYVSEPEAEAPDDAEPAEPADDLDIRHFLRRVPS